MEKMMNFKSIVLAILVALWFAACSDNSEGVLIGRFDKDGYQYSPMSISGSMEYLQTMEPSAIWIEVVDEQLNAVDTIELSMDSSAWSKKYFSLKSQDVEFPILKIVTVFPYGKKSNMEFYQYYRLGANRGYNVGLNIYMALAAPRIEYFVKKKDYSLDDAEDTVLNEMSKAFNLSVDKIASYKMHPFPEIDLYDLLLYVVCRHEVSDSLFYRDFEKLREYYAKNGFIDSSMVVTAADAWLSTFKNVPRNNSDEMVFQSFSRDTVVGLQNMWTDFFSSAYGTKFFTIDSVKIEKKSSAFYGKYFYYDRDYFSGYKSQWRLKTPLEDTLGLCLLTTKSLVAYGGDEYLCKKGSNVWKKNVSLDELQDNGYGDCRRLENDDAIYARDTLFVCECNESDSCSWNVKHAAKENPAEDSLEFAKNAEVEAKANEKFGECKADGYGDVQKLDSLYVQCVQTRWVVVDSLTYHIGHCAKDRVKGKHLGVYYGCRKFAEYGAGDTVWAEIPWPAYVGEPCSAKQKNYVLKDSSSYFICEKNDAKNSGSVVEYRWRKLDSSEVIPPVVNMDTCEEEVSYNYLKKIYDGNYYMCEGGKWHPVDRDSLTAPEKAGDICSNALLDTVKEYDGKYYRCSEQNLWLVVDSVKSVRYGSRDSLGRCESISDGTLPCNEKIFGVLGVFNRWRWIIIG